METVHEQLKIDSLAASSPLPFKNIFDSAVTSIIWQRSTQSIQVIRVINISLVREAPEIRST